MSERAMKMVCNESWKYREPAIESAYRIIESLLQRAKKAERRLACEDVGCDCVDPNGEYWRTKAEKAEARVKELEAEVERLKENAEYKQTILDDYENMAKQQRRRELIQMVAAVVSAGGGRLRTALTDDAKWLLEAVDKEMGE